MSPGSAAAIYLVFWWITLFAVLPFGVRTSQEAGAEPVPGEMDGAPHRTDWRAKLGWTTLIASALFLLFTANYVHEWLTVDDILGPNRR